MINKENENILNWIVWEIMVLQDQIDNHEHITIHTPFGGSNTFLTRSDSLSNMKKKINRMKQKMNRFKDLKQKIFTTPSPFQQLQEEMAQLETCYHRKKTQQDQKFKDLRKSLNIKPITYKQLREEILGEQKNKTKEPKKEELV